MRDVVLRSTGALLIGVVLSVYLTATTNAQASRHLRHKADHWGWRAWVSRSATGCCS